MTALLEIRDLTKAFGGLTAVNGVSFEVRQGEILSVIGPNGAGKSTLFKLISSFLKPTSGAVFFRGEQISSLRPHIAARKGVIRTFQETTVFKDMTALESVRLGCHLHAKASPLAAYLGVGQARDDEERSLQRALAILDRLGLGHLKNEKAKNLPHGHLRALGIAMALAANPVLLLLDEPFAGMNSEETAAAMTMVQKIRDDSVTILLVEHDMQAVMKISDRIVVLNFGQKIAEGRPAEIRTNPRVVEAYLGQEDEVLGI